MATVVSTAAAAPAERSFRPDIEGLRAIAVGLVLLDHAGLALADGGYIGVDVFFVLSGFLITGLLLREHERTGSISILNFYARRARRLLPASTLVLIATVIGSYLYLGTSRANRVAGDAQWAALFASNFRSIQTGTDYMNAQLPPSPLQHFWSLAVEEQFYAVWPALIIGAGFLLRSIPLRLKVGALLTMITVGSIGWSVRQTAIDGTEAYFSPFPRASELALGALLAVVVPYLRRVPARIGPTLGWAGLCGILFAAWRFGPQTEFPGWLALAPVLATVAVIAGGSIAPELGPERLLRLAPFQQIGRLSYSLYLWHWPVIILAEGRAGHPLTTVERLGLYVIALALSWLTYILIEDPVRDSTRLKSRHPLVSVAMGAAMVVIVVVLAAGQLASNRQVEATAGIPLNTAGLPELQSVLQAVQDGANVQSWPEQPPKIQNPAYSKECDVSRAATEATLCTHGDPAGTRTLVIYGDSHAAMWIPALDVIGRESGWRVIQVTKPGCQAADFPRYSTPLKREYTECAEFRTFAINQITGIKPDMLIITSAYRDVQLWKDGGPTPDGMPEAWIDGLRSVIGQLQPIVGRIVILGDMPYPGEPGIDCLTAHEDDVPACNTAYDDAVLTEHNQQEAALAEELGIGYIDITSWFCTDSTCPAVIANLTTHRDEYHAAENYVVYLARVLGQSLGLLP